MNSAIRFISIFSAHCLILTVSCERDQSGLRGSKDQIEKNDRVEIDRRIKRVRQTDGKIERHVGLYEGLSSEEIIKHINQRVQNADKPEAFLEVVDAFMPTQWHEMLDFIASLPPGNVSSRAFNKAISKLASENPDVWLENYSELTERFTGDQLVNASIIFGMELGKGNNQQHYFKNTLTSTEVSESDKRAFLAFFTSEWGKVEPSETAKAVAQIENSDLKIAVMEHNLGLFAKTPNSDLMADFLTNEADQIARNKIAVLLGKISANSDRPIPYSKITSIRATETDSFLFGYYISKANSDLNSALAEMGTIPPSPQRDKIIEALLPQIGNFDAAAQLQWIEAISSENVKQRLYTEFSKGHK